MQFLYFKLMNMYKKTNEYQQMGGVGVSISAEYTHKYIILQLYKINTLIFYWLYSFNMVKQF